MALEVISSSHELTHTNHCSWVLSFGWKGFSLYLTQVSIAIAKRIRKGVYSTMVIRV